MIKRPGGRLVVVYFQSCGCTTESRIHIKFKHAIPKYQNRKMVMHLCSWPHCNGRTINSFMMMMMMMMMIGRWTCNQRTATLDKSFTVVCLCQRAVRVVGNTAAPSSVISRPTCFGSSLRCCLQVGSAPFVRRRCDCLASSAPFTNSQTYLLTYELVPAHTAAAEVIAWRRAGHASRTTVVSPPIASRGLSMGDEHPLRSSNEYGSLHL